MPRGETEAEMSCWSFTEKGSQEQGLQESEGLGKQNGAAGEAELQCRCIRGLSPSHREPGGWDDSSKMSPVNAQDQAFVSPTPPLTRLYSTVVGEPVPFGQGRFKGGRSAESCEPGRRALQSQAVHAASPTVCVC